MEKSKHQKIQKLRHRGVEKSKDGEIARIIPRPLKHTLHNRQTYFLLTYVDLALN